MERSRSALQSAEDSTPAARPACGATQLTPGPHDLPEPFQCRAATPDTGATCPGSLTWLTIVVYSYHRGSRQIEHIGSAHEQTELELLKAVAPQRLAAGQGALDLGPGFGGGGVVCHAQAAPAGLCEKSRGGTSSRPRARRTPAWARPAWCSMTCPRSTSRPARVTGSAAGAADHDRAAHRRLWV
jgi:hypothetical protein